MSTSDDVDGDSTDSTHVTGSSTRKPTPAASAASRARRIGGATAIRTVPAPEPETPVEPVTPGGRARWSTKKHSSAEQDAPVGPAPAANTADDGASSARRGGPDLLKRHPRITSAGESKKQREDGSTVVAEVPGWLRWAPAVVLSVCALAMIIIIAVSAHGVWYAKPSTTDARDKVLAAAKKCTSTTNTYNYKTLAADEKRGLACTTGAWTAQYKSALEKIVKPTATKLKASQTVQINAAGVESVSSDAGQWTTIVYGQLTINQSGATPRVDPFAAIVRMDKVKSSYLVSKIDLITNPSA